MKAAREMASRPLWLFDSLLLREALAEVNLAAVPAIVRAACGLSQRDLARSSAGVRRPELLRARACATACSTSVPRFSSPTRWACRVRRCCRWYFADPGIGLAAVTEDGMDMELSRRGFGELMAGAGWLLPCRP